MKNMGQNDKTQTTNHTFLGERPSFQQTIQSLTPLRSHNQLSKANNSHYLSQRNIENYKNNPNGKIYNQAKLMMFI